VVYVHINEPTDMVGRGFFIITSMVSHQISAEDAMGQWIRAVPQHLSSANRPKQTTQVRPVHNECERFDTIESKKTNEANEANLLSALRRPRPAATGKSWHRKSELACAVGRGRKDPPPPTNH
jgi:hypothetical protein